MSRGKPRTEEFTHVNVSKSTLSGLKQVREQIVKETGKKPHEVSLNDALSELLDEHGKSQ